MSMRAHASVAASAAISIAMALAAGAGCYSGAEVSTSPTGGSAQTANNGSANGGASGSGGASDPFSAPATCTSGQTSTAHEGSTMRPGEACIACHASSGEAPMFAIAGTVYKTGHEPNDCMGVAGGLTVVITDATGATLNVPVNRAGNFSAQAAITMPYHAKVIDGAGNVRAMGASQSTGDCNTCHTQDGANGAPGRIAAP